ncbi:MAG: DUF1573 domain-containing protein [Blastocatellia bacterium]
MGSAAVVMLLISGSAAARQTGRTKTAAPAPRAVVPIVTYDFGDVYKGEVISQLFLIRNEGDAEFRIESVTAGCGCSVVDSDRVFAPGQEGRAELQVTTVSQAGRIRKIVTLHTNDPARPHIVLTVTANVLTSGDGGPVKGIVLRSGKHIGPIFLGPDSTALFTVTEGKTGKAEFNVTVERGNLKILRIEATQFISRIETLQEGKSYKLVLESRPDVALGSHSERARVVTDSDLLPYFFVNVNVTVMARQSRQYR